MKSTIASLGILLLISSTTFAYTEVEVESANFLSSKNIINDNSENIAAYNLNSNITRREMLKVMMNLSGKTVVDNCSGDFSDIDSNDWGCKYAEAALAEGYIAANANFRPDDNVTQIEALKMIMQAKGIERDENDDWRAGYVSKADSEGIIASNYLEYNDSAVRGWIFESGARTYADFEVEVSAEADIELTPEEEELFEFLLEL